MVMKQKESKKFLMIWTIICLILGIGFLVFFMNYYSIKWTTILLIPITFLILVLIYLPFRMEEKKKQLVNQEFVLDISNRTDDAEHIRLTQGNVLFKYKVIIKYFYIFPRVIASISLKGKLFETPAHSITDKIQLSAQEREEIIEKINTLKNDENGNVIVNYKGEKKFTNRNDVNKIFEKYSAKICL